MLNKVKQTKQLSTCDVIIQGAIGNSFRETFSCQAFVPDQWFCEEPHITLDKSSMGGYIMHKKHLKRLTFITPLPVASDGTGT